MTTGGVNLFPDPYFAWLHSRSTKYFTHSLIRQSGTNGTWDSTFKQPYAPDAWKYTASSASTLGFSTWFTNPDTSVYNIAAGDTMSAAMYLNVPSGKKVQVVVRFFGTGDDDLMPVAGLTFVTGDGSDVQTGKVEGLTVPSGANGLLLYTLMSDTTDYHVLAAWLVRGATAGGAPAVEYLPDILLGRVVGASTVSYPLSTLLTRAVDAAGTIAATTDTSPVQYYMKRATGAALWTPPTQLDF